MSIADKLVTIAENEQKVYDAGVEKGHADGAQSEYDRFWDEFQQNGKRKSYMYGFAGTCWTQETLKPKYPIAIVDTTTTTRNCAYMFAYLNRNGKAPIDMTELCKMIDFSEALNAQNLFYNADARNITVDLSKATNLTQAFACSDGGDIDNIMLTVTEACTNMANAFASGGMITSVIFTEGSVIAAKNLDVKNTSLNTESLMSIINALKDFSGTATTQTCTLGEANLAKLTDAEKAIATEKGWTLA